MNGEKIRVWNVVASQEKNEKNYENTAIRIVPAKFLWKEGTCHVMVRKYVGAKPCGEQRCRWQKINCDERQWIKFENCSSVQRCHVSQLQGPTIIITPREQFISTSIAFYITVVLHYSLNNLNMGYAILTTITYDLFFYLLHLDFQFTWILTRRPFWSQLCPISIFRLIGWLFGSLCPLCNWSLNSLVST